MPLITQWLCTMSYVFSVFSSHVIQLLWRGHIHYEFVHLFFCSATKVPIHCVDGLEGLKFVGVKIVGNLFNCQLVQHVHYSANLLLIIHKIYFIIFSFEHQQAEFCVLFFWGFGGEGLGDKVFAFSLLIAIV